MSKSIKLQSDQRGISLIEAMLAMIVLTVGVLAAVKIFPLSMKISRVAEQETIAANLAQAEIETLFEAGYNQISAGTIEPKHRLAADAANPFYNYQRQTVAYYVDSNLNYSGSATGMIKVSTTVYWISPQGGVEMNLPVAIIISEK